MSQCSQDSLDGTATGWTATVWFPTGARDFSYFHSVQTNSGAHPASYTMGTRGSFTVPQWSWPLTFIYCQGQEWWNYTSTSPYIIMAWCFIMHRDFTFLPLTTYLNIYCSVHIVLIHCLVTSHVPKNGQWYNLYHLWIQFLPIVLLYRYLLFQNNLINPNLFYTYPYIYLAS
jgi:hypothetical protein